MAIQRLEITADAVYKAFSIGCKIGILQKNNVVRGSKISRYAKSFEEFCAQETVSYWMDQLRGSRYKNLQLKTPNSTQTQYAQVARRFDFWLAKKSFTFHQIEHASKDTFHRITKKITLKGIEHLLTMFQMPYSEKSDYIRIVKTYLLDEEVHKNNRAETMMFYYHVIRSYFEKNESPLDFKFNPKARYVSSSDSEEVGTSMSLEELMKLLTVGGPSITEKAVFLCKFHRGLDTSTLSDRFNFEAWEQLEQYFSSENHNSWDIQKCPVPIKLVRIKTGFLHTGFLDRDAIVSLQEYLDFREKKTGQKMSRDVPLFLTKQNKPISTAWISDHFERLSKKAGLHKVLPGYRTNRYKITPHELRDLLKSTMIDCGCRPDAADHFIGHKPKDSYEKQTILYPESLRKQYFKASSKINVFSNFAAMMQGTGSVEGLQQEVLNMKLKAQREQIAYSQELDELRQQIMGMKMSRRDSDLMQT